MAWTPPPLQTPRLDLIALTGESAPDYSALKSRPHDFSGLPGNWTIFMRDTEVSIGSIGFIRRECELGLAELGFILKHSERRQGYMSEACRAVIDFGFQCLALKIVEGRSMPHNEASVRLLRKVGLRKTGSVSARLSQKGACVDLDVYRIAVSERT